MNNSNTPKIVIGVGLVALYAVGFTVFALRGRHDSLIAQNPPATVAAPLDAIPESAALAIPDTGTQPEVSAAAAMPAPQTPAVTNAARGAEATRAVVAARPEPRAEEVPIASLPSPRPPAIDDVESSRGNSGSNTVADLAIPAANPGESVSSVEEAASDVDGQVTETPALNSGEQ